MLKTILGGIKKYAHHSHWNIGFVEDDIRDVLHADRLDIHWMKHDYKDRWFADPQLLSVTDKEIVVLVEEFVYSINRGRIAKLTVDRADYTLKDMKIILDQPTHLSFPFIYRKGDEILIMPENSRSGSTKMYRYDPATDEMTRLSTVSTLLLADAVITRTPDGKEFLLSTKEPMHNKDRLQVYNFNPDTLSIDDTPVQTITFASNIARNAGEVFEVDGIRYRPAQDCNKCYGNGIVLQRMDYGDGKFTMTDINIFHSDYPEMDMGYHTFNLKNGLIVVDGHGYDHKFAHALVGMLGEAIKRTLFRNKQPQI